MQKEAHYASIGYYRLDRRHRHGLRVPAPDRAYRSHPLTDDIATGTFLMMGFGSACFAVQGILTGNIPLFVTNLLTTIMSSIVFGIKIYNDYFKKRR